MKKISTKELILRLMQNKKKVFEVALVLEPFRATHIMWWGGKKIFDTGIDSQEITWRTEEFQEHYSQSNWIIDQVV